MKNIYFDAQKTLGRSIYMGVKEKAEYATNVKGEKFKTGEIEGYVYTIGSSEQNKGIEVFIPGELRNINFGQDVEIINAVMNVSAQASNNFATTRFNIKAEDIRPAGANANTAKKDDFPKKDDKKVVAL